MVKQRDDGQTSQTLTDIFNIVSKELVQNLEVAALMGQVNEQEESTVLPGGVGSQLGYTEAKTYYSKKKKRDKKHWDRIIREIIRQSLEHLQEIIKFYTEQMNKLFEQIQEAQTTLEQLEYECFVLEGELQKFQETGLLELDKQGKLKNKEAEYIICTWEQKIGIMVDRADPESYGNILRILMEIEAEQQILKDQIEKDREQYDEFKAKREEAIEVKEALESDNPNFRQNAFIKAKTLINNFSPAPRGDEISPLQLAPNLQKYDIEKMITDAEQEGYDDFSFGFPPLQDEFSKMAVGTQDTPIQMVKEPFSKQNNFKKGL